MCNMFFLIPTFRKCQIRGKDSREMDLNFHYIRSFQFLLQKVRKIVDRALNGYEFIRIDFSTGSVVDRSYYFLCPAGACPGPNPDSRSGASPNPDSCPGTNSLPHNL